MKVIIQPTVVIKHIEVINCRQIAGDSKYSCNLYTSTLSAFDFSNYTEKFLLSWTFSLLISCRAIQIPVGILIKNPKPFIITAPTKEGSALEW